MTICIAAACEAHANEGAKIVVCVDALSSSDLGSVDYYHKDRPLPGGWHCLISGPAAEANALLPLFSKQFRGKSIDETNVCSVVRAALAERKQEKANEFTIGKFGLHYHEFREAKGKFPDDVFSRNFEEIEKISLPSDLLVVGFLSDGFPIIVRVFGHTVEIEENFAVVGSGAILAQASLLHRDHKQGDSLSLGLYRAYEAKRHAERVRTVGPYTHLAYLQANRSACMVLPKGKMHLEREFLRYGPKELPHTMALPFDQDFETVGGNTIGAVLSDLAREPKPTSEESS